MKTICLALLGLCLASCASATELKAAQSQVAALAAKATQAQSELSLQSVALQTTTDQLSDLQVKYDGLNAEKAEVSKEYAQARREAENLSLQVQKFLCEDQIPDMKYENIPDASTILMAWWARQPDVQSTNGTYRDTIWSNAETKIHAVMYTSRSDNKQYVEHFLVYFDEFGMSPALFWVKGQCWLDAP